ncbi:MAG TPA: hypothetical protein PKC70_08995 [Cellvibrionaceae bacterium]|nr:hypothetical protein [Cellvibrionaceae bacterium]
MRLHLTLFALASCLIATPVWSGEAAQPEIKLTTFRIGKLHIGMPASEVVGLPGCVFTKGKLVTSEADGGWHQTWRAPRCGLTLGFSAEDKKSPLKLFDMKVEAPSTLKTEKGIGIGSTDAQVRSQYLREINTEESISQQNLVLGSVYGGVIFELDKGRGNSIFVGAAAE